MLFLRTTKQVFTSVALLRRAKLVYASDILLVIISLMYTDKDQKLSSTLEGVDQTKFLEFELGEHR